MKVIGVDVRRHIRRGDEYVTVIIDLTPVRDTTGPARLLDVTEGRSKSVFEQWPAARPRAWRNGIEGERDRGRRNGRVHRVCSARAIRRYRFPSAPSAQPIMCAIHQG